MTRRLPIAVRLVAGLLLLVAAGTGALLLPGIGTARPLALHEAMFTAVSALTVTGLSVITPGRDLTVLGQAVLMGLIQMGGVGFMVVTVAVFRLLGRRVLLEDRLALKESLGLATPAAIVRLTKQVLITVSAIQLAGAGLLWWNWRGLMPEGQALFFALFHAVSAFCNAGFDLFSGAAQFPAGLPGDTLTLTVLGSLIALGSLGIPVLAELIRYLRDRALSLHTRLTLVMVALLIGAGTLGLLAAESAAGGALAGEPWGRRLELALFQSVATRTAGFVALPGFEDLQPASQLTLIVLMFVGSAPASMGGGITTGTAAVLGLALWGYARGLPTAHVAGRQLAAFSVRKAAAVLTVSLAVVSAATWVILITHPGATLDQALFEVVSAFATCGLTLAFTGELNLIGQAVIMAVMFWGRLGALTIVTALGNLPAPTRRLVYPEEQVLIG